VRPRRLLVFALEPDATSCALLEPQRDGVRLVERARAARNGDLGASLAAARGALTTRRPPRDAIVLHPDVVAGEVRLPSQELSPERLDGLVRWELDPYLEPGDDEVAVGWARGAGDALRACAARAGTRDAVVTAARRAGLRLRGIYPGAGAWAGAEGADGLGPDLVGGARRALGVAGGEAVPCLSLRVGGGTWWKRAGVQAGVLLLLVSAGLLGVELYLSAEVHAAQAAVSRARTARATAAPVSDPEVPRTRRELARGLLAQLGELTPAGVGIERFTFDPARGIEVEGWADDPELVHELHGRLGARWRARFTAEPAVVEPDREEGLRFELSYRGGGAR